MGCGRGIWFQVGERAKGSGSLVDLTFPSKSTAQKGTCSSKLRVQVITNTIHLSIQCQQLISELIIMAECVTVLVFAVKDINRSESVQ